MKFEIDQSGKIEQLSKDTVLCLSNDEWDAVTIKRRTKRQIQEIFRRHGRTRNFILFTFSAGVSLLIKRNKKVDRIIIDQEYFGKEPVVKAIVLEMLRPRWKVPEIIFAKIGRRTNAHSRAYLVFSGKLETKHVLSLEKILAEIKATEVGKRLKNA